MNKANRNLLMGFIISMLMASSAFAYSPNNFTSSLLGAVKSAIENLVAPSTITPASSSADVPTATTEASPISSQSIQLNPCPSEYSMGASGGGSKSSPCKPPPRVFRCSVDRPGPQIPKKNPGDFCFNQHGLRVVCTALTCAVGPCSQSLTPVSADVCKCPFGYEPDSIFWKTNGGDLIARKGFYIAEWCKPIGYKCQAGFKDSK